MVRSRLIEPAQAGLDLTADVHRSRPSSGSIDIWRLGQAGVIVKFFSATVLVDPYLSNHCEAVLAEPFDHRRMTRSPLDPAEIDFGDILICTHDHLDHLDVPTVRTLARQLPHAFVVVPAPAVGQVERLGWRQRVHPAAPLVPIELCGLQLTPIAVAHENYDVQDDGYPYLGMLISNGHITVLHIGDCVVDEGLLRTLRGRAIDVLLAPINGRSPALAALGFQGNMSGAEAAHLAAAISAGVTIPLHYDMFQQNVQPNSLEEFVDAAAQLGQHVVALEVGQRFRLERSAQGVNRDREASPRRRDAEVQS